MPVRRCGSAALSPRLAGEGADGASRLDGLGDGAQWRSHLGTLGIPLLTIIYIDRNNDSDRGANRRQCNHLKMRVHACENDVTDRATVGRMAGYVLHLGDGVGGEGVAHGHAAGLELIGRHLVW